MDVFDVTAACLGCTYISDLRRIRITGSQADAIRSLPKNIFPLPDFNRLAEYITGEKASFPTAAKAKEAIIHSLLFSSV